MSLAGMTVVEPVASVALVSEHASPLACLGGVDAGGQNVYVAALARELGRREVDTVVYTRRDGCDLPRRVELAPHVVVEHVDAGPPLPLPKDELLPLMREFADALAGAWNRRRPDVVHAHFWMSGLAALRAARPLGIPVVETFHALGVVKRRYQGSHDPSPARRLWLERVIAHTVDAVAATSREEVEELERCGARPRCVEVVPCGVDTDLFRGDRPAEHGGDGRLLVLGRLVERKGIDDVIRALPLLPDARLLIAGGSGRPDDPHAHRLATLALELGVSERVTLLGPVARSDVPSLLRAADVVVCVPWYEPFGMVAVEAMACGVPVVASAVGGLLDTVVDGETGLHVPPRDPVRLAAAVRMLLDDEPLRARLGGNGARRAGSLYTWRRVANELLGLYGRVVATRVP
jgi:D-inositol-3-phosphate glycosyltransferase